MNEQKMRDFVFKNINSDFKFGNQITVLSTQYLMFKHFYEGLW